MKPYLTAEDMNSAGLRPGVLDDAAVDFFANGHCASMALALHKLTEWPVVLLEPYPPSLLGHGYWSHSCVQSPLGLLDAHGPFTVKEWMGYQDLESGDWRSGTSDLDYAEANLELVIPLAKAVLERYFPGVRLVKPSAAHPQEGEPDDMQPFEDRTNGCKHG